MASAMTPDHCDAQLKRLTLLKGIPEEVIEYFAALQDVPDDRFTAAVSHALRTRVWFPSPAELRADVDATAPPAMPSTAEPKIEALPGHGLEVRIRNPFGGEELVVKVDRIWKFDCEDCIDSGWRSIQCPKEPCGRRKDHAPHEFVEPCGCRGWNPTLRRRTEALGAKYATAPASVDR